jgi:PEP-CTERM motif
MVMVGLLISSYPQAARADQIWTNGLAASIAGNCDSSPDLCHGFDGNSGWTVYDDFIVTDAATISNFSFDSFFQGGSESDYLSTNWSIWNFDPIMAMEFGIAPVASGNSVATLGTDYSGAVTVTDFSITGLDVDVDGGVYWIGYSNVLDTSVDAGAFTVSVLSDDTSDLPEYEQVSNDGLVGFNLDGNTVFAVNTTPEPSAWALAALGLAYFAKRRRIAR